MEGDSATEYDDGNGEQRDQGIERRAYLKLAGTAVASVAAAASHSGTARAASSGYGEGRYGEGPYGGESSFAVVSDDATNVANNSATLNGSIGDLGGADSADCYFEWRQSGASSWNTTAKGTISSTVSFSADIDGLSGSTTYEYRGVAEASDGATDTGSIIQFTTDSSNAGPAIDFYEATEDGSPNPHCEITADWRVSDEDDNLDTVVVQAFHDSGTLADAVTEDVSGSSASGTGTLTIKHADGQTFSVKLTVVDSHGDSASWSETVTE